MRTLDEQHNGRKKIIRYKTDLSIEINRDSYNHEVHHAHSLIFYWKLKIKFLGHFYFSKYKIKLESDK
jgi:hypothetical protein